VLCAALTGDPASGTVMIATVLFIVCTLIAFWLVCRLGDAIMTLRAKPWDHEAYSRNAEHLIAERRRRAAARQDSP
jgi:hypothetical protein